MVDVVEALAGRQLRPYKCFFAVDRAEHTDRTAEHEVVLYREVKLQADFILYGLRLLVEDAVLLDTCSRCAAELSHLYGCYVIAFFVLQIFNFFLVLLALITLDITGCLSCLHRDFKLIRQCEVIRVLLHQYVVRDNSAQRVGND